MSHDNDHPKSVTTGPPREELAEAAGAQLLGTDLREGLEDSEGGAGFPVGREQNQESTCPWGRPSGVLPTTVSTSPAPVARDPVN